MHTSQKNLKPTSCPRTASKPRKLKLVEEDEAAEAAEAVATEAAAADEVAAAEGVRTTIARSTSTPTAPNVASPKRSVRRQ